MTAPSADATDDDIDLPRVPLTSRPRTMLALLLLATTLVFLPALGGEFVWDDTQLIYTNSYIRDLSRLGEALTHDFWHNPQSLETGGGLSGRYYRPVITLAYALQFRVFGEHPAGYHVVNLALHLGCVVLAFGWLRRRLDPRGDEGDHRLAALAWVMGAALFAVHPSRPESVAWISGSTDLWLGLFALLGLRAWDTHPRLGGAVLAGLCFFFATLSKETAVVLPALLLVDIVLLRPPETRLGVALGRWAVAAAGVGFALVTRFMVVSQIAPRSSVDTWSHAPQRVLSSFGHYLFETFAPWWPSIQTSLRVLAQGRPVFVPWSIALGAVGVVGLLGLLALAWRRPPLRPWAADALWFVVALGPTLNLVPLGMNVLIALRFLYLPLLGVCALLARAALGPHTWRGHLIRGLLGVALVGCAVVTSRHAATFSDRRSLWTAELRRNPGNYNALRVLSTLAFARGDHAAAGALLNRGQAAAMAAGVNEEAVRFTVKAAQFLLWSTPDDDHETLDQVRDFFDAFVTAEEGTARLHTRHYRIETTLPRHEAPLRRALRLETDRAWAYFRTGDTAGAEAQLRVAARRPNAYTARRYLAQVLAAQHRWDEARAVLDNVLRATPADAEAARLRSMVDAYARSLDDAPDGVARTSLAARLWTDLTRPQRARELVAPLLVAHPERVEPVAARLYAELADHRAETAEMVVREAAVRAPAQAAAFREALQRARAGAL
jgi:tetratricopeptide (TPR) repeat protein